MMDQVVTLGTTLMACGATAVVCLGTGTIVGRLFGLAKYREGLDLADDNLIDAYIKIADRDKTIRKQGRELAELIADNFKFQAAERRRAAQRRAAGEKGRAAQQANKAALEAEARAVREATHSGMRARLAELI